MIIAASGSAKDIQEAINKAVAQGETDVYIPEGTFNFVEVGESWQTVNIPAGINLFGAPTERDAYDQVVEWRTILKMPWDVSGEWGAMPVWFAMAGSSDPTKPSRFSDIKLVGYRSIDPASTSRHRGITVDNIVNFRIDHCCLEHTSGGGIKTWGLKCNGVIDHSRIYNIYGFDDLADYMKGNIGYGVHVGRAFSSIGYDPTMSVLGQYTDYTVFIEDCYFSKWRHCVASSHGAHYVFRHNTIEDDFGHFSLDVHGLRDTEAGKWGTRAAEFYENTLINAVLEDFRCILQNGGGCGVWFNNYIDASYRSDGLVLYPEDYVPSETWHLKDFYLWSKKGAWTPAWDGIPSGFTAGRNVKADWNRSAYDPTNPEYPNVDPAWSIAGYIPYPYPHPLAVEERTIISGVVVDAKTDLPIEGATVSASVFQTTTLVDGSFALSVVPGTYTVRVEKQGYHITEIPDVDATSDVTFTEPISLTPIPPIPLWKIALPLLIIVSGGGLAYYKLKGGG